MGDRGPSPQIFLTSEKSWLFDVNRLAVAMVTLSGRLGLGGLRSPARPAPAWSDSVDQIVPPLGAQEPRYSGDLRVVEAGEGGVEPGPAASMVGFIGGGCQFKG